MQKLQWNAYCIAGVDQALIQYLLYTRHTPDINVAPAIYQVWARYECSTCYLTRCEPSINVMPAIYQREKKH